MFHSRGFRGSRRKSGPRPVVKTYKKVLNFLQASFGGSGFTTESLAEGVDSIALGQTSNIDGNVPTGTLVKYFEVQFAVNNSVATPCFVNCTLQYTYSGQTVVDPNAVGGAKGRNQVLHQDLFTVGDGQNSTHKFKFKIPKQFQRMKEGMKWHLVWSRTATVNREIQVIYKVYS